MREKLNNKVSIITPVYNSVGTIRDTLTSVAQQTYNNIEHIVIDNESNDGTEKIVEEYEGVSFLSESDNGIYDGMNKGIKLASGDIIAILNSDDFYANNKVIEKVVRTFKETKADTCYGNLVYVERENTDKIVRHLEAGRYMKNKIEHGWFPPHPAFFVRSAVYKKYGYYDTKFSMAADFEFMLRTLRVSGVSTTYIPETLTVMRTGGYSDRGVLGRLVGISQKSRALIKYDYKFFWNFMLNKLSKLKNLTKI